jgi:hypothetical protein
MTEFEKTYMKVSIIGNILSLSEKIGGVLPTYKSLSKRSYSELENMRDSLIPIYNEKIKQNDRKN